MTHNQVATLEFVRKWVSFWVAGVILVLASILVVLAVGSTSPTIDPHASAWLMVAVLALMDVCAVLKAAKSIVNDDPNGTKDLRFLEDPCVTGKTWVSLSAPLTLVAGCTFLYATGLFF